MKLRQYKKAAAEKLRARRSRVFYASFLLVSFRILLGCAAFYLPLILPSAEKAPYALPAVQTALLLFSFGLLGSIRQGKTAWLDSSARGRKPSSVHYIYWIRRGRGFRAAALRTEIFVRKTIWRLLLCAPGIALLLVGVRNAQPQDPITLITIGGGAASLCIGTIFYALIVQKYALAPILLAQFPHKKLRALIRASCSMMEDQCKRLFLLKLSFLPALLSCVCLLPIPFVVPKYQQTNACMLRDILRENAV